MYDTVWVPLNDPPQGFVDVGHQFEWAFLVSEAVEAGHSYTDIEQGKQLIRYGLEKGYDPDTGGIVSPCTLNGDLMSQSKGWWQQCEAIRALYRYCTQYGMEELEEPLHKTVDFVKAHYIDPEFEGWFSGLKSDNTPSSTDKGSMWKVDYHTVGMCKELAGS
jgi:mannose/cellobiose epimerase-like protein (N-acyl-D-glucosamine 2-epimerase family)